MQILVINIGSSSLKYGVLEMPSGRVLLESDVPLGGQSIDERVRGIADAVSSVGSGEPSAIGHRVVHGGARFAEPVWIDDSVLGEIDRLAPLAPLHNINAVDGIRAARSCWPQVPQAAVFDTSFHAAMPQHAAIYAIPAEWREAGVRRYGFHGISHQAMMERAEAVTGRPASELRIVSFHLGNGASACAINGGRSIDTSMGMTPLEGLVMGTRSGDVDPGLYAYLERTRGLSVGQVEDALYRRSGLSALSGMGGDMRSIEAAAKAGDARATQALDAFCYRARKFLGAYAAAMGGLDVVSFTGGIGENSAMVRAGICQSLDFLGIHLDAASNEGLRLRTDDPHAIHSPDSPVKVIVAKAAEQKAIAKAVFAMARSRDDSFAKEGKA